MRHEANSDLNHSAERRDVNVKSKAAGIWIWIWIHVESRWKKAGLDSMSWTRKNEGVVEH